jgi:hypothetical protein
MRKLAAWAAMIVVALLFLPVIVGLALAQETVVAPAPTIWTILAEPLGLVVAALLSLALGWLTPRLARLIGQDEANKLQAALQAAGNRAAGIVIMKLSGRAFDLSRPLPAAEQKVAIDAGVAYLKETMPDTIRKLGAGDEALRKIVEANLGLKIGKS